MFQNFHSVDVQTLDLWYLDQKHSPVYIIHCMYACAYNNNTDRGMGERILP